MSLTWQKQRVDEININTSIREMFLVCSGQHLRHGHVVNTGTQTYCRHFLMAVASRSQR